MSANKLPNVVLVVPFLCCVLLEESVKVYVKFPVPPTNRILIEPLLESQVLLVTFTELTPKLLGCVKVTVSLVLHNAESVTSIKYEPADNPVNV